MKKLFTVLFLMSSLLFATIPSKPTLHLPANNAIEIPISSYVFKWHHSTGTPTSYHIQISQISTFGYFAVIDSTHSDTTKTVTTLTANTKYYWRVRSKNGSGISAWSDVRSFTTVTSLPSRPILSAGNGTNEKFFRMGLNAGWVFWNWADSSYWYIFGGDTTKLGGVDTAADYTWTGKHTFKNVSTFDSTMYLANNQFFGSKSFVSGWAGSGWKLDYGLTHAARSNLEIDDITVRGSLSAYELLVRQIRATNGAIFVTASAKVSNVVGTTVTFYDPSYTGTTYMCPFAAGDLLIVQKFRPNGTTVIELDKATVSSVSGADVVVVWNTGTFSIGDEVVRVGNTTDASRQNSIYLTSDDSNSPFVDMTTGVDSWTAWGLATKTKLRLGNLTGITDADFGGALSGYGLYAQNIYLKGAIRISNPTTFVNGDSLSIDVLEDGSTYRRTTHNQVTGAGRAYTALNSSNVLVTAVIPATAVTPGGAGLFLGSNYLGYHNGSIWKTYMDNAGNFYLSGSTAAYGLSWNAGTDVLTIAGAGIVSGAIKSSSTMTYARGIAGTEAGYFLGLETANKLFIGSSAAKRFSYDGTDLTMVGGTITGGTIQTATGTGQRAILSGATNDFKFYDVSNNNIIRIGENVLTSTPGIIITNGVLNGNSNLANPIFYGIKDGVGTAFSAESSGGATNNYCYTANSHGTGTNYGIYATAFGGTTNWSGYFDDGNVGIGAGKFVVNSSGQLTKVNNISPTAKYVLIGDATSFTPRLLAMSDLPALTANRVLLSDGSGYVSASSISNTTLGYLDATSSIQTQLNGKATAATTLAGYGITDGVSLSANNSFTGAVSLNHQLYITSNGTYNIADYNAVVLEFGGSGTISFSGQTNGQIIYVYNYGDNDVTVSGITVTANKSKLFRYNTSSYGWSATGE